MNPKVAVVSFPWKSYAPYKFLSDVIKILEPISESVVIIDGNIDRIDISSEKAECRDIGISLHFLKDIKPLFYSAILWIIKCFLVQIITSFELIKIRGKIDVVLFYLAYPYYLLPLITAKIIRIKTIEVLTRSKSKYLISKILSLQDPLLFRLLDGISPESKTLINEFDLRKHRNKLLPEGSRFIDISFYISNKELAERKSLGFIGRIREEKGVMEFVNALPIIVKKIKYNEFLIGGSGDLLEVIKIKCKAIEKEYNIKIIITGFIEEEKFPTYLNRLKLLIMPTKHAEGLPTIILESMACGTVVLATSVGGIPTIIKDCETGFIMKDSSPVCIAENVIRVLNYPDLDRIVKNARRLIEDKFTFEAAVKRYKKILEGI